MSLAARNGGKCVFCAHIASVPLNPTFLPRNATRLFSGAAAKAHSLEIRDKKPQVSKPQPSKDGPHSGTRKISLGASFDQHGSDTKIKRPEYASYRSWLPSGDSGNQIETKNMTITVHEKPNGSLRSHVQLKESTYNVFAELLLEQVDQLTHELSRLKFGDPQLRAWNIHSMSELDDKLNAYKDQVRECTSLVAKGVTSKSKNPIFYELRQSFITGGLKGLAESMKNGFINDVINAQFSENDNANQQRISDLRYPLEWYPATRELQRVIHLHVGPTNSGKTYHALQRLEAARTGVYAGPLRLLAHEVYSRFNAKGVQCALVTGEERRYPEGMTHVMHSCTVEMVPLNAKVDVAVIDEIQMISDRDRGWAWTQAFLGVQAKEVHLCGELRTVQLITDLCAALGEKLIVHRYERLSPLAVEKRSLNGDLKKLRKGDAVILFSRVAIHAMKTQIEKTTGKRCAIVYGSLPPETRAQQAAFFNDPDNDYDYLVASDAVGMGLNLSIRRVIFESTSKHDGSGFRIMQPSEIKQIGGRAGRYKTARDATHADSVKAAGKDSPNKGWVTSLEKMDLPIVEKAMSQEVAPLKKAGIFPPDDVVARFASYFPANTPFSFIMLRLHDIAKLNPSFFLCNMKDQIPISDAIQEYDLSVMDRLTFLAAPTSLREYGFVNVIREMANCVATQSGGHLLDLKCLNLDLIEQDPSEHIGGSKNYLRKLETLHKAITLYLWLSYRFHGVFRSQALAFHVKKLVEDKIDVCLSEVHFNVKERNRLKFLRLKEMKRQLDAEAAKEATGQESSLESDASSADAVREQDGSDADEAFEDSAVDMDDDSTEETNEESEIEMESDDIAPEEREQAEGKSSEKSAGG